MRYITLFLLLYVTQGPRFVFLSALSAKPMTSDNRQQKHPPFFDLLPRHLFQIHSERAGSYGLSYATSSPL